MAIDRELLVEGSGGAERGSAADVASGRVPLGFQRLCNALHFVPTRAVEREDRR